jgi:hypothetical protein
MKFAPGTPESVMREYNEKFYGNKRDKSKMLPPPKPSADQRQYDKLASRPNLSPSQQRLMDRLGAKIANDPNSRITVPTDPGLQFGGPMNPGQMPLPPTMRTGPSGPTKPTSSVLDRTKVALNERAGSMPLNTFDADRAYPGPRVRGGPMNPGPMPPPPTSPIPTQGAGLGSLPNYGTSSPRTPGYNMGTLKKGGAVKAKKMSSGGMTSKASPARRGDGIAQRGKTKGRMV